MPAQWHDPFAVQRANRVVESCSIVLKRTKGGLADGETNYALRQLSSLLPAQVLDDFVVVARPATPSLSIS